MKHNVVVANGKMIAGDYRSVLYRGEIFFPRYPVDYELSLFYQTKKIFIPEPIGKPTFETTRKFFAKIIHLVRQQFFCGRVILYGHIETPCFFVRLNPL